VFTWLSKLFKGLKNWLLGTDEVKFERISYDKRGKAEACAECAPEIKSVCKGNSDLYAARILTSAYSNPAINAITVRDAEDTNREWQRQRNADALDAETISDMRAKALRARVAHHKAVASLRNPPTRDTVRTNATRDSRPTVVNHYHSSDAYHTDSSFITGVLVGATVVHPENYSANESYGGGSGVGAGSSRHWDDTPSTYESTPITYDYTPTSYDSTPSFTDSSSSFTDSGSFSCD
jgi:hypothetical protein